MRMAKKYTQSQIDQLKRNPNVLEVTESSISYLPEFKVQAVKSSLEGNSPASIFIKNGFDLDMIGKDIPRKRLYMWRRIYEESGELGLLTDHRGKNAAMKGSKESSIEDQLKKAEAKIKFLEMENEFLKKLDKMEREAIKRKRN